MTLLERIVKHYKLVPCGRMCEWLQHHYGNFILPFRVWKSRAFNTEDHKEFRDPLFFLFRLAPQQEKFQGRGTFICSFQLKKKFLCLRAIKVVSCKFLWTLFSVHSIISPKPMSYSSAVQLIYKRPLYLGIDYICSLLAGPWVGLGLVLTVSRLSSNGQTQPDGKPGTHI